jgi:Arc/MetJ family transcription regulator
VYIDVYREVYMRTNIVLDDKLVEEAFRYTLVRTKKDLVEVALKEFIRNHSKKDLRDLVGNVKFFEGYDYKALRGR